MASLENEQPPQQEQTSQETPLAQSEAMNLDPTATEAIGNSSSKDAQKETTEAAPIPISKKAMKKMRKRQEWEDGRDDRRKRRKEKRINQRARKRDERAALIAQGVDPESLVRKRPTPINVPVSLIFDCDFEQFMMEKELISLGSQMTRSYSENKNARFRTHLWISNWNGKLRDRFHNVLEDCQKSWKGIEFLEGDFVECAAQARVLMKEKGGTMTEALERSVDEPVPWVRDEADPLPLPDPEPEPKEEYKDIVYLSSDSPYTLERLEPHTSYVIGGLVDKNREKGLCYKRARELGIRTARLPIGQYMVMQSRQVLATNHVVEIMLKWLEFEDWGKAFLSVIPKRKGGQLRGQGGAEEEGGEEEEADDAEEDEEEEQAEAVDDGDAAKSDGQQANAAMDVYQSHVEAPKEVQNS